MCFVRVLMEKFRDRGAQFWAVFVDLEKAFDRVPRKLIWHAMRRKGVSESEVKVVQDMYKGAKTVVFAHETKSFSTPLTRIIPPGEAGSLRGWISVG